MSKAAAKNQPTGTVADQVAEFIGRTLGDLLNRKDGLARQMAEVDGQIADVRRRVTEQFGKLAPAAVRRARRPAAKKASGTAVAPAVTRGQRSKSKSGRVVSAETRAKMAAAARRRWAVKAQGKDR